MIIYFVAFRACSKGVYLYRRNWQHSQGRGHSGKWRNSGTHPKSTWNVDHDSRMSIKKIDWQSLVLTKIDVVPNCPVVTLPLFHEYDITLHSRKLKPHMKWMIQSKCNGQQHYYLRKESWNATKIRGMYYVPTIQPFIIEYDYTPVIYFRGIPISILTEFVPTWGTLAHIHTYMVPMSMSSTHNTHFSISFRCLLCARKQNDLCFFFSFSSCVVVFVCNKCSSMFCALFLIRSWQYHWRANGNTNLRALPINSCGIYCTDIVIWLFTWMSVVT